jgi:arginine deiminase
VRFLGGGISARAAEEHTAMTTLLRGGGAEVLTVVQMLDDAVRSARAAGALDTWLRGWAPQLVPSSSKLTGAALLGAADEFIYRNDPEGNFAPLTDPLGSFYWTRDSAVMTPKGVAICRFSNDARTPESILIRFAYEWAPALKRYPIVFDANEEQVAMEGGDIMVAGSRMLWMGVGNRSQESAARRLALRLDMDVLAISMPPADPRTPINGLFLHLDTVCTLVNDRTVLTLPWFFEAEHSGRDPLTRMLRGLSTQPKAQKGDLDKMVAPMKDLGRVKLFKAGTGQQDKSTGDAKLVDWLRGNGYAVVNVGGPPPATGAEKHAVEVVLPELRRQASNIIALAPGRVVAYGGNPRTRQALLDAGVEVLTFDGSEIMRNNGGPHCLTQPLERS